MASPTRTARHQPAPDQQDTELVAVTACATALQAVREPAPFVITPLQLMQMASACLSAQAIADALDRDVPIDEKRQQVRHEGQ